MAPSSLLGFFLLAILALFPSYVLPQGPEKNTWGSEPGRKIPGLYPGPFFDKTIPTTVTAQAGTTAYLLCRVKQLEEKQVSWVRRSDAHILSVGTSKFISDKRFHIRQPQTDLTMWSLQIKNVQKDDAGEYECQISTEPKRSYLITLKVVVPKVNLIGAPDIFVNRGSTIELKCQVSDAEDNRFIFWYKDNVRILDAESRVSKSKYSKFFVETLHIDNAKMADAGNYTCFISDDQSASAVLHVLSNGEHSQAMHEGTNRSAKTLPSSLVLLLLLGRAVCSG